MDLEERIKNDMKTAMRSKDVKVRDLLRVVISFIDGKKYKITDTLEDKDIFIILKSLVNGAIETGNIFEIEILERYLPKMLNDTEHLECIRAIIEKNGYTSMKQMGLVIKEMKSTYVGCVDGKLMSDIIKKEFN